MSVPNEDITVQPLILDFPCNPHCNCQGRRILDCLQVTTTESCLCTLEDLQKQLNDKVSRDLERLEEKVNTTQLEEESHKLNNEECINFLDILDQSLAKGCTSTEYSIRGKLLMKNLSDNVGRLPRSFYRTGVTVTHPKYDYSELIQTLHLGTLNNNGDVIAIKEPKVSKSDVRREALVWRYLDTKYIVPLLGVTDIDAFGLCLLSPHMEKGNIMDYLQKNPTPDDQVMNFIIQIVEGIDYLHNMGIVHGDIKPANILVGPKNTALITGLTTVCLGQKRFITPSEITGRGTFRYMSPELRLSYYRDTVEGEIKPTKNSDVFSLGMTLYEVLTGRTKCKYGDWKHVWDNTRTRNGGPINKYIVKKIISPCWRKNHALRPTVAELLQNLKLHGEDIFSEEMGWRKYIFLKFGRKKAQAQRPLVPQNLKIGIDEKPVVET